MKEPLSKPAEDPEFNLGLYRRLRKPGKDNPYLRTATIAPLMGQSVQLRTENIGDALKSFIKSAKATVYIQVQAEDIHDDFKHMLQLALAELNAASQANNHTIDIKIIINEKVSFFTWMKQTIRSIFSKSKKTTKEKPRLALDLPTDLPNLKIKIKRRQHFLSHALGTKQIIVDAKKIFWHSGDDHSLNNLDESSIHDSTSTPITPGEVETPGKNEEVIAKHSPIIQVKSKHHAPIGPHDENVNALSLQINDFMLAQPAASSFLKTWYGSPAYRKKMLPKSEEAEAEPEPIVPPSPPPHSTEICPSVLLLEKNLDTFAHMHLFFSPPFKTAFLRAIKHSQKLIQIMSPVLTDPEIIRALIEAAKRGVRIELVLLPPNSQNKHGKLSATLFAKLPFQLWDKIALRWAAEKDFVVSQAKFAIFDGQLTITGSSTLTQQSIYRDSERDCVFESEDIAQHYQQVFTPIYLEAFSVKYEKLVAMKNSIAQAIQEKIKITDLDFLTVENQTYDQLTRDKKIAIETLISDIQAAKQFKEIEKLLTKNLDISPKNILAKFRRKSFFHASAYGKTSIVEALEEVYKLHVKEHLCLQTAVAEAKQKVSIQTASHQKPLPVRNNS